MMTLMEELGDCDRQIEINWVNLSDPFSRSTIKLKYRCPFVPNHDDSIRFLKIITSICYYKYCFFKAGEVRKYSAISNLTPLLSGLTKQSLFTVKYPQIHTVNSRKIKSTSQRKHQVHRPALSSYIFLNVFWTQTPLRELHINICILSPIFLQPNFVSLWPPRELLCCLASWALINWRWAAAGTTVWGLAAHPACNPLALAGEWCVVPAGLMGCWWLPYRPAAGSALPARCLPHASPFLQGGEVQIVKTYTSTVCGLVMVIFTRHDHQPNAASSFWH